jgi:uncharacterized protein (TIGR02996 family)
MARSADDKFGQEKQNKGSSPLQQSLEQALAENPDDLAAHSAYADYLTEQGDPRGEFISVQLALEDPKRPPAERKELQQRESELLQQHARQWLGDVGRFLHGDWSGPDKPYHYHFTRGWLDLVRVLVADEDDPADLPILAALARAPETRLLRRLEVVYDMRYHPFDFGEFVSGPARAMTEEEQQDDYPGASILGLLVGSPYLANLRVFKLGFSDTDETPGHSTMVQPFVDCTTQQVLALLKKCPRLEELYLNTHLADIDRLFAHPSLGNLRVLQYYYGTDYYGRRAGVAYPLGALAGNASLKRLTTLRLHPGRDATVELPELDALLRSPGLPSLAHLQVHMTTFGDEGCRRIVDSGILRRLKTLDVGYGSMTDDGARILAECPDLKNLEVLDVSRNALTGEGIDALQAVGIQVLADRQHGPGDHDYLYEVDHE